VSSFLENQKGLRSESLWQEKARPVFKFTESSLLNQEKMKYDVMQTLQNEDNKLRNGRQVGMVTDYHLLEKLLDDKSLCHILSQSVEMKNVLSALNFFMNDLQAAQFSKPDCDKILAACLNDFLTTIDSKFVGDLGSQVVSDDDIEGQLTRDIDYGEGRCDILQGKNYCSSTKLPTSFANLTASASGSYVDLETNEIEAIYRTAHVLFDAQFIQTLFDTVFKLDSQGRLLRSCTQRVVFSKENFLSAQPFARGGKISLVMVSTNRPLPHQLLKRHTRQSLTLK